MHILNCLVVARHLSGIKWNQRIRRMFTIPVLLRSNHFILVAEDLDVVGLIPKLRGELLQPQLLEVEGLQWLQGRPCVDFGLKVTVGMVLIADSPMEN